MQDNIAWCSGGAGLFFLFIILLIVILTWRRCPSCYTAEETQLVEAAKGGVAPDVAQGIVPFGVKNPLATKYSQYTAGEDIY